MLNDVYRYGVYEKALHRDGLNNMLDKAAELGFQTFELSLDESDLRLSRLDWDCAERKKLRAMSLDSGVEIYSTCFSGQRRFPMGSADEEKRKRSMELMGKAVRFCAETGIRVIQVAGYDVFYEPSSPETEKRFMEGLFTSARIASEYGVMLALETVEYHVTSVAKAMEIVQAVGSPWLQVYPDVANMLTEGFDPVLELRKGKGHMVGLHIREARRDTCYNLPLGSGELDFPGIYRELRRAEFNSPIVVELWYEDDLRGYTILKDHLDYFRSVDAAVLREIQNAV